MKNRHAASARFRVPIRVSVPSPCARPPRRPGRPRDPSRRRATPQARARGAAPRAPEAPRGTVWLYGQHVVAAALANPARRLRRLLATEAAATTLAQRARKPWLRWPQRRNRGWRPAGSSAGPRHRAPGRGPAGRTCWRRRHWAQALERPGPLLVLDQVTDPRNVGAILRLRRCVRRRAGLVVQERHGPEETGCARQGGVRRAGDGAGAARGQPGAHAGGAEGGWLVGGRARCRRHGTAWRGACRAARGAGCSAPRAKGWRRLTRETCDELAGLVMPGVGRAGPAGQPQCLRCRCGWRCTSCHGVPNFDPAPAARLLAQARAARGIVRPAAGRCGATQPGRRRGGAIRVGREHGGRAAGPASRSAPPPVVMQEYLGLPGPSAGFMPATGVHASGAVLPYAAFVAPGVECEIAVRLAGRPAAGALHARGAPRRRRWDRGFRGHRGGREPLRRPESRWGPRR